MKFAKTLLTTAGISAASTLGLMLGVLAVGEVMTLAEIVKRKFKKNEEEEES